MSESIAIASPTQSRLKASVRMIDKTAAQEMIDASPYNRRVTAATVAKYAQQMTDGRWLENGEPIIINGGKLLNGAHRLNAIVESDVTLPFVLVEGVEPKANRTMDIGKPRSLAQMLELEQFQAPNILAQMINWIIGYLKGTRLGDTRKFVVLDKFNLLEDHPEFEEFALRYTMRVPGKFLNQGLYACADYLFSQKSKEASAVFMKQVISGENLSSGDPAYTYREAVSRLAEDDDRKKTKLLKAQCANSLIFAWNKFRAKETWPKFKLIDDTPEIN